MTGQGQRDGSSSNQDHSDGSWDWEALKPQSGLEQLMPASRRLCKARHSLTSSSVYEIVRGVVERGTLASGKVQAVDRI